MDKRTCVWDGCTSENVFARGLCPKHLKRAQRSGRVEEFPVTSRRCFRCDVEFVAGNRGGKKFCSESCRLAQSQIDAEAARQAALGARACARCDMPIPLDFRADARYCSVGCQQASWYDDNSAMLRKRAGAWKKANWALALEYEHRRRAVTRSGVTMSRVELMERDSYECYICGELVDADLRHPDPRSSSLDHKIPISRGGAHSNENTAIVHLRCNLVKGTKTPDEMGLMGVV